MTDGSSFHLFPTTFLAPHSRSPDTLGWPLGTEHGIYDQKLWNLTWSYLSYFHHGGTGLEWDVENLAEQQSELPQHCWSQKGGKSWGHPGVSRLSQTREGLKEKLGGDS